MNVGISKLPLNERDRFIEFVRKTNPKRIKAEKRFNWQMTENPHLPDKEAPPVYIATDNDNNIVGHFLLVPFSWYFDGQEFNGFWGVDYYVQEQHRGMAGALLAIKAIRGNQPYFTIDPSEAAKQIATALKAKTIGYLQRSIWFRKPLSGLKLSINTFLVKSFLKRVVPFHVMKLSKNNFPDLLDSSGQWQFQRLDSLEEWEDCQWPDVLGFSRSADFINWRFINSFKKCSFYRLNGPAKVYFVVRPAKWNGLNVLVLVDYRLPYGDEESWQAIVQTVKDLAILNRCDGVVTMHSHAFFDSVLKKSGFNNDDKPLLIVSTAKIDLPDDSIESRNGIFATMADCDIDINFGK